MRQILIDAIKPYVDEYRVDSIGNLIALKRVRRRGKRRPPVRVMIAAHMDEVGVLIVHTDDDGRLRFKKVGGIDNRVLLSKVLTIGEKRVAGIIGVKPIHELKKKEREQVIDPDDMRIDIGAKSKSDALEAVRIGDFATFDTRFSCVGDGIVRGKALDDRTGCSLLVELLAVDYPFDLYAAFTVQEEVGLRGAHVAAYTIQPDLAFVLESTVCDDSPKEKDVSATTRLGFGPALTVADRSVISDKRLVKLLMAVAEENDMPFQIKQPLIGSTDAGRLHTTRGGVPTVALAVPTRYLHSPVAFQSLADYDNTRLMMQKALPKLDRGISQLPG